MTIRKETCIYMNAVRGATGSYNVQLGPTPPSSLLLQCIMALCIRLSDVFLSPDLGPTELQCMIYESEVRSSSSVSHSSLYIFSAKPLDELEYSFGVERGWLLGALSKESEHLGIIWEESESLDTYQRLIRLT